MSRPTTLRLALLATVLLGIVSSTRASSVSVRFAADPVEQGLRVDRSTIEPATVKVDGRTHSAWMAGHQSVESDDWLRRFRFEVTDASFTRASGYPVEVEVVFRHEADTKVEAWMYTDEGRQLIEKGWGGKKSWQTMTFTVPDAVFDQAPDLEIRAWAGDFHVREVTLRRLDPSNPASFQRYMEYEGMKAEGDRILDPGESERFYFGVKNTSRANPRGTFHLKVAGDGGDPVHEESRTVELPAGETAGAIFELNAGQFPEKGIYHLSVSVTIPVPGGEEETVLNERHAIVAPGPLDAFIVFEKDPIQRGMDFAKKKNRHETVTVDGERVSVREAYQGSFPSMPWARSLYFNLTDPRFQEGNMPVVDVTAVFRHTVNTSVLLFADTETPDERIGFKWDGRSNFQTIRTSVDNAYFGRREHSDAGKMSSSGYDLRISNFDTDLHMRSIYLRGYDLRGELDIPRVVKAGQTRAAKDPAAILAFRRGERADLSVPFENLSKQGLTLAYQVRWTDYEGNELHSDRGQESVGARGEAHIQTGFDTGGLKNGLYFADIEVKARTDTSDWVTVLDRETGWIIYDGETVLPKAADGEFLYGLDAALGRIDGNPTLMDWLDFMGTDMLRNIGTKFDNTESIATALERLKARGVTSMLNAFPQYVENDQERRKTWAKDARQLEELARRFKDDLVYYEIGNEPDLTFFFPGPMSAYVEGFEIYARAIKAGNPDALILNGGLCFFGEEGDRRARAFINTVDAFLVDIWTYHAHGNGAEAERSMYRKFRDAIEAAGKLDGKPFMDTESGMAAKTREQRIVQARSAIQKFVFVQSKAMPSFMWFRLSMTAHSGNYSNLNPYNDREPKPAILAYRTMVQNLRGLGFDRLVDLSDNVEAYLFRDAAGKRSALVAWTVDGRIANASVRLFDGSEEASARVSDMFGNTTSAAVRPDGSVGWEIGPSPQFLTWGGPAAAEVGKVESPIKIDTQAELVADRTNALTFQITNPLETPLEGSVELGVEATERIGVEPDRLPVRLAPGATGDFTAELVVGTVKDRIVWPSSWTVFMNVPVEEAQLASYDSIPAAIEADGFAIEGVQATLQNHTIDFTEWGNVRERAPAVAMAYLYSTRDQVIEAGATADWWMQCFVNGKEVMSTMDSGNGGAVSGVSDHTFEMPLKKGRNLIVYRVLSGSGGWKLKCGGPTEIARERMDADGGNRLQMVLRQDDATLGRQTVNLKLIPGIYRPDQPVDTLPAEAWLGRQPGIVFPAEGIENFFEKHPDGTRWYQGTGDLSARGWLALDDAQLHILVAVTDDRHRLRPEALGEGDALEVRLGTPGASATTRAQFGLANGTVHTATVEGDPAGLTADIERMGDTTFYRIRIPRGKAADNDLRLDLKVLDNDDGYLKQTLHWHPTAGNQPEAWYRVIVE